MLRAALLYRPLRFGRADQTGDSKSSDVQPSLPGVSIPRGDLQRLGAIPYVIDMARARSIYALGVDAAAARDSAFTYLYTRQHADGAVSVPWEWGPISPDRGREGIFLFSPGRCGSTLVNAALNAAGATSVSEPDIYHVLLSRLYRRVPPIRPIVRKALANATRDLLSVFGSDGQPLIIKLRAQLCAVAPAMLTMPSCRRKTIFLIRHFEPWAKSTMQAFDLPPQRVVDRYSDALKCCDFLRRHSECLVLRYEDLVRDPEAEYARLGGFLGSKLALSNVRAAFERDSQAETPLDRSATRERSGWARQGAEAMRLWQASDLPRLSRALGLD